MGNKIDITVTAKDMASNVLSSVTGQIDNLSGSASGAGGILERFGGWLGGVFQTAMGFITANVFNTIASSISNFIGGVITGGAELERLKVATTTLGENMGYTTDQINGMVDALAETNTWGANAYNSINSLIRSGLMPLVEDLKIVDKQSGETNEGFDAFIYTIKDLSAAMGVSSSEGIEIVTEALIKQRDETLQSLGINMNLRVEYEKMADSLGKTTEELTNAERSQAILNGILKEGEKVAGTYAKTYETSGKNLLSIKDALESTQQVIGELLSPAITEVTNKLLELVKGFRKLFVENETIKGQVQRLVDAFSNGFNRVMQVMDKVFSNPQVQLFMENLLEAVVSLIEGGINWFIEVLEQAEPIIVQIAELGSELFNIFQEFADDPAVQEIGQALKDAFSEAILIALGSIRNGLVLLITYIKSPDGQAMLRWVKDVFVGIGDAIRAGVTALTNFRAQLMGIDTTKLEKLVTNISKLVGTKIGETLAGLAMNIPKKQSGGHVIATKPTLMMVGERVPERVDVTPIGSHTSGSGGGNVTININGAGDPVRIAQEVQRILARANSAQSLNYNLGYR